MKASKACLKVGLYHFSDDRHSAHSAPQARFLPVSGIFVSVSLQLETQQALGKSAATSSA
jgi:hypothetical protein